MRLSMKNDPRIMRGTKYRKLRSQLLDASSVYATSSSRCAQPSQNKNKQAANQINAHAYDVVTHS